MSNYFQNPEDLNAWVLSKPSHEEAASAIMDMIESTPDLSRIMDDEQDVFDACRSIFEGYSDEEARSNASKILFGVLAKHNITQLNKTSAKKGKEDDWDPNPWAVCHTTVDKDEDPEKFERCVQKVKKKQKKSSQDSSFKKEAQSTSRQRNQWSRGERNKWNRVVDGFNEGTPWRVGRDKYYDFTHYYTDEVKFDEDPHHIYSGEAIWRTYVMDKFYRDYKNEEGRVVGGYINDRFYVFPTAGTPANPDVPRDHGNQLALADGERTRQPKPHEYSMERRLEEGRGNETKSIMASEKNFKNLLKLSSSNSLKEARDDKVYNIFKDTIEMREAGINYETMIDSICEHYNASVFGVAQIDKFAQNLVSKHEGIGYSFDIKQASSLKELMSSLDDDAETILITEPNGVRALAQNGSNSDLFDREVFLKEGTVIVKVPGSQGSFEVSNHPDDASLVGSKVQFPDNNFEVSVDSPIQEDAFALGLNGDEDASLADPSLNNFSVVDLQ